MTCQRPSPYGICGGEVRDRIVKEEGRDVVYTVCGLCGQQASLSGGLPLKGNPPEQMSFPEIIPEQMSLEL